MQGLPQVPAGVELPAYGEEEDIVKHQGYTAAYNHTTLCPDWVAWELTSEEVDGTNEGQYSFSRDPNVKFPVRIIRTVDGTRVTWRRGPT